MSEEQNTINTEPLDSILKALIDNKYIVKVGVLSGKNSRKDALSNATIGAVHEFGNSKLPQRSFLRMPLQMFLPKELEKVGILNDKDVNDIIKTEGLRVFTEKLGILAVATVLKAFDSGGFGLWKPSNMEYKKVKQTLVETHQLRDSITYDVKKVK